MDGKTVGSIGKGLVILLGIFKEDAFQDVDRLAERILNYRIFEDELGKMNCSGKDLGGELLIVFQFTLAAYVSKGTRPSFSSAAEPDRVEDLYHRFIVQLGDPD